RSRHASWPRDWSSDVCSSDLTAEDTRDRTNRQADLACRGHHASRVPGAHAFEDFAVAAHLAAHGHALRADLLADEARSPQARQEIGRASCRDTESCEVRASAV